MTLTLMTPQAIGVMGRALATAPWRVFHSHHGLGQFSTLEATCAALAQLEGSVEQFQPLLNAFDGFVAQQLGIGRSSAIC